LLLYRYIFKYAVIGNANLQR